MLALITATEFFDDPPPSSISQQHHGHDNRLWITNSIQTYSSAISQKRRRRLELSPPSAVSATDKNSEDEEENDNNNDDGKNKQPPKDTTTISTASSSSSSINNNSTTTSSTSAATCTPMAECELCPHNYKVLIEKEDEKMKGEYDSCAKYGRRRQFECTVLFREKDYPGKQARTHSEYRECRYTNADEQFRMLRMQMICLLVGLLAMRYVRRQRVASASLFDQRRMRIQNSNNTKNGSGNSNNNTKNGISTPVAKHVKYSPLPSKNSMETIELTTRIKNNFSGKKIPKSPAPPPYPKELNEMDMV